MIKKNGGEGASGHRGRAGFVQSGGKLFYGGAQLI